MFTAASHRSFLLINCVLLPCLVIKTILSGHDTPADTPQPETPCCCCGSLIIPNRSLSEQSLIRPKSHCSLPALISVSLTTWSETARSRSWDQQAGNKTPRLRFTSITAEVPSRSPPASRWHSEQQLHPHLKSPGRGWSNIQDLLWKKLLQYFWCHLRVHIKPFEADDVWNAN